MKKAWPKLMALLLAAACGTAAADSDHDRARSALERGEVLPLHAILEKVGREYPGKVVEVELEREDGRWIYELRWLMRGGALVKLEVDARNGNVLGAKDVAGRRDLRKGGQD